MNVRNGGAARALDRAQHLGSELMTRATEFVLEEAVIKPGIVGNEHPPFQTIKQIIGHLGKRRCFGDHGIGNARQDRDEGRDRGLGINQGAPLPHAILMYFDDTDFGNPVDGGVAPCRFQIDEVQSG